MCQVGVYIARAPLVNREMVKEIMIKALSGLQESSSMQSHNNDATRKEAGKLDKYRLLLRV